MKYVGDIGFGLIAVLCITAIVVVTLSVKRTDKGWLLGFLILSLVSYMGFYVPVLLVRNGVMAIDTYRRFIEPAGVVSQVLRLTGWVLLLVFIFALKSSECVAANSDGAGATGAGASPLPGDSPYRGYGGWLRLFGVFQLYLAPIFAVVMLVVGASAIAEASSRYPSFVAIYSLEALGTIAIVALGMYAAIQLRGILPGAVRAAKRYLLAALVWSVLSFALPYMGDIPDSARERMLIEYIKGFVKTLIPFAIWFTYFNVSKRVRVTYVDDDRVPKIAV